MWLPSPPLRQKELVSRAGHGPCVLLAGPATSGQVPISSQPRAWQRYGGWHQHGAARGAPLGYTDMKAAFPRKMGEFLDLVLGVRIICMFSVMGKPIRGTRRDFSD